MLGFLSRKSRLHFFEAQETMTAQFVIESIEALLPHLSGPTVLVLDSASVHRSKLVQAKRKEWKQKGLRLLFLPPYCPHLNLIEALWRQTKYRWLDCEAYRNFETLCRNFETLLTKSERNTNFLLHDYLSLSLLRPKIGREHLKRVGLEQAEGPERQRKQQSLPKKHFVSTTGFPLAGRRRLKMQA